MLELLIGNTVVATLLAIGVLFFCRCFRPGPATRHALWLLVVLKLLSPVGLLWEEKLPFDRPRFLDNGEQTSALPLAAEAAQPAAVSEPIFVILSADNVEDASSASAIPVNGQSNKEWLARSESSALSTQHSDSSGRLRQSLYLWFFIIWLAGALAVAKRCTQRTRLFARYARSGKPASPSLQRQVDELAAMLRVRAPLVRVLPGLPSPVVWCLFRPVVLWPRGLQDQLSGEGRRTVIVHELAHLLRKDHWFRWLELAAAVIHWWNPLFWLARRQMRFHAELACDAWVTGTLPEGRRAYAEALLEVCARTTRAAAPSPAVGVGGDGRRDFQRRLTMIMRDRVPCRLAAGARMFVVLMAIAALPAWTLGQAKRETLPAPKTEVENNAPFNTVKFTAGVPIQFDDVDFDLILVDAGSDEQKAKELQARIAELTKQLKAIHDAKAAADKLKKVEPLEFKIELGDNKLEQKLKIIRVGPDGKPIEIIGDRIPMVKPMVAPLVEDKNIRIIMVGPDGKVIELGGGGKPAPKVEFVKPVPGHAIKVEIAGPQEKQPQIRVIGPDGKEIKDVKILIERLQMPAAPPIPVLKPLTQVVPGVPLQIELQLEDAKKNLEENRGRFTVVQPAHPPASGTKVVALNRATYKLPKDKAETLAAFLKANVKASVLEMKIDEAGLTVTTTPEVQATIGGIANLMHGQSGGGFQFRLIEQAK